MQSTQDIGQLSDADLRQELINYGVNVGPIVSTTRLFYEKKLGKLIDSNGQPPQPETESEEEDYEDEEEDEEVQINYKKAPQQSATPPRQRPQPVVETQTRQRPQSAKPAAYKPVIQPRTAEPTTPYTPKPVQSKVPQKPATTDKKPKSSSGGGIGMLLKLLFIIFVAALIYLVIVNMNPSAQNKIPSSLEDPGV